MGIKSPVGQMPLIEPQYLATLPIPTANEHVRLNYTFTSGAMPPVLVSYECTGKKNFVNATIKKDKVFRLMSIAILKRIL